MEEGGLVLFKADAGIVDVEAVEVELADMERILLEALVLVLLREGERGIFSCRRFGWTYGHIWRLEIYYGWLGLAVGECIWLRHSLSP